DEIRRDLISGERIADSLTAHDARSEWIVDCEPGDVTEIAEALLGCGDGIDKCLTLDLALAVVIGEKERVVFPDRPANRSAVLIATKGRLGLRFGIEVITRIEV